MKQTLALAGLFFATPFATPAHAIDWLTVGDPGNFDDNTGHGAVAEPYRIGKFEITNAEYAE